MQNAGPRDYEQHLHKHHTWAEKYNSDGVPFRATLACGTYVTSARQFGTPSCRGCLSSIVSSPSCDHDLTLQRWVTSGFGQPCLNHDELTSRGSRQARTRKSRLFPTPLAPLINRTSPGNCTEKFKPVRITRPSTTRLRLRTCRVLDMNLGTCQSLMSSAHRQSSSSSSRV